MLLLIVNVVLICLGNTSGSPGQNRLARLGGISNVKLTSDRHSEVSLYIVLGNDLTLGVSTRGSLNGKHNKPLTVMLMYAQRGTAVPCAMSAGYLIGGKMVNNIYDK